MHRDNSNITSPFLNSSITYSRQQHIPPIINQRHIYIATYSHQQHTPPHSIKDTCTLHNKDTLFINLITPQCTMRSNNHHINSIPSIQFHIHMNTNHFYTYKQIKHHKFISHLTIQASYILINNIYLNHSIKSPLNPSIIYAHQWHISQIFNQEHMA